MQKLFFLLLLFPLLSYAQPKTTLLPGYDAKDTYVTSIGRDHVTGNLFLLCRKSNTSLEGSKFQWDVEVLSPDLKQLHAATPQDLSIPKGSDALTDGEIISMKANACVIFPSYKKKEKKTVLYRATICQEGSMGALQEAGSLQGDFSESSYSQLILAYSADSSLLLVTKYPSKFDPKEPYSYVVIDQNGKALRQGNFQIQNRPEDIAIGYPIVTNDGTILTPVWVREENLRQEVWIWGEPNAKPRIVDISFSKERVVTDLLLRQSPFDGQIYGGGTFAAADDAAKGIFQKAKRKNDPNPEQGSVSLKLDYKAGKVISHSEQPFSASTLNFWGKNPEMLKKGDGLNSIRVAEVLPMRDGSTWVGLEEYYLFHIAKATAYNYTPQSVGTFFLDRFIYTTACSESAILAHHGAGGGVTQETVMGKRGSLGVGYFLRANDQGELVALYTDNEDNPGKNITREDDLADDYSPGAWHRRKNACVALFTATPTGKTTTKRLFTQKDTEKWLDPKLYVQTGPNTYVFICSGGESAYNLLKLE